MTMYKTGDYSVFTRMSVAQLRDLVDWKISYEEQKRKMAEEETKKRETEMKSKRR